MTHDEFFAVMHELSVENLRTIRQTAESLCRTTTGEERVAWREFVKKLTAELKKRGES